MDPQLNYLQRQQLILQSEIRVLQKQKRELELEIERMESVRSDQASANSSSPQLSTLSQEVRILERKKLTLESEVERLEHVPKHSINRTLPKTDFTSDPQERLHEKKITDLQSAGERAESSFKEQSKQFNQEIKDLTKRRDQLMEKVELLKTTYSDMTSAYTKAKEDLEAYKNEQLDDANKEISKAKQTAETINLAAETNKNEAQQQMIKVQRLEKELTEEKEKLDTASAEHMENVKSLAKRLEEDNFRHEKAEFVLGEIRTEIEKLKETIKELLVEKETLTADVKKQKEILTVEKQLMDERVSNIIIREKTLENKTELINKKAQEQLEQARLLKDRRESLDRAVEEMRAKGAKI